ncbi:MAG: hypothetical protein QG673_1285 [Pseudomonadota bacterium]|nr:hypothetical protein [Pseudomonadota bacterium]
MRLISLNIWGGYVKNPLLEFITRYQDVDFFCLQEVYHNALAKISADDKDVALNIFSEIQSILSDHIGFFQPVVNNIYGLALFVKKNIIIEREGHVIIHENPDYIGSGPTHSRILQWVECRSAHGKYTIINLHGLWNGAGKSDSPARIEQSNKVRDFISGVNLPKVLCGDFNLRPDTQSMKIIEHNDMLNLIISYGINCTRSPLYLKAEKFADYTLTSPEVLVHDFVVLQDVVSDHLPLLLDFDLKLLLRTST